MKKIGQGQIDTLLTTRLDFDGTKLSDKYVIRPYNWQGENEKEQLMRKKRGEDYYQTSKISSESEQALITTDNRIDNIEKYILGIIIPPYEKFLEEFEFYAESDVYMLYNLTHITDILGYEDDFNEDETEYTEELVKETYDYIIEYINNYSNITFKKGMIE